MSRLVRRLWIAILGCHVDVWLMGILLPVIHLGTWDTAMVGCGEGSVVGLRWWCEPLIVRGPASASWKLYVSTDWSERLASSRKEGSVSLSV